MTSVLKEMCPGIVKNLALKDSFPDQEFTFSDEISFPLPKDTGVMHLRLGDVLNESNKNKVKKFAKGLSPGKYGINKMIMVCGMHLGTEEEEQASIDVIKDVRGILLANGIRSIVVSNEPDQDACVINRAHTVFVNNTSGFSTVAVLGGGKVVRS